jgi:hypothetical protein
MASIRGAMRKVSYLFEETLSFSLSHRKSPEEVYNDPSERILRPSRISGRLEDSK